MKKVFKALVAGAFLMSASAAWATPSTTFWTPATAYVQPFGIPHLTYDTYFGEPGAFPIDTGITIGVLPFEKLQAEVGFDLFYPGKGKSVVWFNGKLGVPEGALAPWAPGLSAGIMGVGLETDVSNWNMLHVNLQKTFPYVGTLVAGGYYGLNDKLFVDASGNKQQVGFLGGWQSPDIVIGLTGLNKINLAADIQTGKNAFGAVGGGVYFYFTPAIDVLTGPVFFFESAKQPGNASWLWTVQLDVDFDLSAPKKQ